MTQNTNSFLHRFFDGIIAHPVIVLALFLLAAGALGWQARRFEVDASADTLLMRDNINYILTQKVTRQFSDKEFLFVAYKPRNGSVFDGETLTDLRELTAELERMDRVVAARSILNVPILTASDALPDARTDISRMTLEHRAYEPRELAQALTGHPIYEDLLINKDQTALAIQVLFKGDDELEALDNRILDIQLNLLERELTREERQEIARLKKQADPLRRSLDKQRIAEIETMRGFADAFRDRADIYFGGVHVLAYQLIHIIKNDLYVFGIAMAAIICLILFLLYGKLRWVIIPAVCCVCSVLSTMGLFGLLGLKTTVISSNFIALQLILTLALVMHLIVQYREFSAEHPGWSQDERIRQTLVSKASPVFYAGLTTCAGFASLVFSKIQPVIAFGWMMIIAMCFTTVVSLILFPSMIALFRKETVHLRWRFARVVLNGLSGMTLKHPVVVTLLMLIILVASVGGLYRLTVENSFINYFRDRTRVHQELAFIDREIGGTTPLDIVHTLSPAKGKQDLVISAAQVQTLQRIQQTLERYDASGKLLSVVNFADLAFRMNGGKPLTEYELTAAYRLMDESMRKDLFGAFLSPEDGQVRFSLRIQDTTEGLSRAQLIADIRNDMERLSAPDEPFLLTSFFVLYQEILEQLFRSQILTLGLVFGALALTLLFIFRSIRIALITITPNIMTTLVVLGAMGWLDIPLDLMTITVAAIAMGVAVDNTIHYTHRYLHELRSGQGADAVHATHGSVGFAIQYTSLTIILGFSLLAFSDFVPSALFGLLTGLAMAMSYAYNLTMLPVLLNRFVVRSPTRPGPT